MSHSKKTQAWKPSNLSITDFPFPDILEFIPNAILIINSQGYIILANEQSLHLFGYSRQELLGLSVEQLIPQRFHAAHTRHRNTFLQKLQARYMGTVQDLFAQHHDGSEFPVEIGLNPIVTATDTFIIASIADISRRKQAEHAHHESEERFRQLIETTHVIPWEMNARTFQFTYIGPQAVNILGYPVEEWYQNNFWPTHILPEDRAEALHYHQQALQKHDQYQFDYRMIAADGHIIWIHNITQVRSGKHGIEKLHGFLIDVTERKHAEVERQALLEIMQGVIMTTDLLELLSLVHRTIARAIYAENFTITLYNKKTGLFEEAYSIDKYDPPEPPSAPGKSITAYVFRTGQPLLLTPERFATLVNTKEVELVGTDSPSWLGVPLKTPQETIGVMVVQHYELPDCYSERDVAFLSTIAGQIALVIEKKWAEEKLRESEEQYRTLIENLPIGVYRNTPGAQGTFLMANPAFVHMFGFASEDEVKSVTVASLYTNPVERLFFSQNLLHHGNVTAVELRLRKKDGTPLWGAVTARIVRDTNGEPLHFDCTVEDITQRKLVEEALQASEQHYFDLFQNVPVSIWEEDLSAVRQYLDHLHDLGVTDLDNYFTTHPDALWECINQVKVINVNQNTLDLYRIKSKAELMSGLAPLFNQEALHSFKREILALAQGATFFATELSVFTLQGEPMIINLRLNIAPGHEQSWNRVFVAITDITDRKLAELEARQRADEFAALYETAHDLALQWDLSHVLETIVSRAIELLHTIGGGIYLYDGHTGYLTVAVSKGGAFPPDVRLTLGQGLAGLIAQNRQPIMLDDYHSWSGRASFYDHIPIRAIAGVPMIYSGELIGVLLVEEIGDVDRRFNDADMRLLSLLAGQAASAVHNARLYEEIQRHAETLELRVAERTQELAHANEQLTVLDRLKSRFVADVSHELRTPVSSLKLYLDLLERNPLGDHNKYLRVLRAQTDRLQQLIEDILDLSRLELGYEQVTLEPVMFNEVVAQVVAAYQLRAQARGLTLIFDPADDLLPIMGERNQLSQVVTNLLVNALNYTEQGEVFVRTLYRNHTYQVLEVSDTGPGISDEDLPHLFQRFYRGSQHHQGGIPGTGLGLAIVKEIVEIHQGKIEVESVMGVGSTFRIWLPTVTV